MRHWNRAVIGILVCSLSHISFTVATAAAEPDLAEFVGRDVGVCLEIRDLKSLIATVPESEWFRRLNQLSLVRKWQQGQEYAKLQAGKAGLETMIGQPLDRFASELFGESVLIAVSVSSRGEPTGILLSRAEKEQTWDRVLQLWDQLEAHDVQSLTAFGRSYQRRRKTSAVDQRTSGPDIFTAKIGRVLAASENEELIRNTLARAEQLEANTPNNSFAKTPIYQQSVAALPSECMLRIVVNPRVCDSLLNRNEHQNRQIMMAWQSVEWIACGVELRNGISLHGIVRHSTNQLPSWWRQFIETAQTDATQIAQLPGNAFIAGRFQCAPKLFAELRHLDLSEKSQRDWKVFENVARGILGRDLITEVLPAIRSGFTGAIVPKTDLTDRSPPVDALLALEFTEHVSSKPTVGQPTLRESLDGTLLTLLNLGSISHNSANPTHSAILRRQDEEGRSLRWLEGLPPYRLGYGLSDRQLVLATDPNLVSRSWSSPPSSALAANELFRDTLSHDFPEFPHWIFVNCESTRDFISKQHGVLSRQFAYWRHIEPTTAGKHLDRLVEILTPFDALFAASKTSLGELRFTVGLATHSTPER